MCDYDLTNPLGGKAARRGISSGDITVHLSIGQRRGNDSTDRITAFL